MKKYWKRFGNVLLLVFILLISSNSLAQEKFPTKPINIIVPFAAGGAAEINAQFIKSPLQKVLGVPAVIVLKPGAGTTIGMNYVANSPPDGYTIAICTPSLLCSRYTMKAGVSHEKFVPIIRAILVTMGIAVKADASWNTFEEFLDYAKSNPGKVLMGNSGHGALNHVATMGIEMVKGVKFNHMPLKGTGPMITALIGGHIDGGLIEISTLHPFIEAKRAKVLAVTSPERISILPNVPTFHEQGIDLGIDFWHIYFTPIGTPKDRIQILHNAFKEVTSSKEYKEYYEPKGVVVQYMDLQTVAAWLEKEDKGWKKIIDFGGFKPMD